MYLHHYFMLGVLLSYFKICNRLLGTALQNTFLLSVLSSLPLSCPNPSPSQVIIRWTFLENAGSLTTSLSYKEES